MVSSIASFFTLVPPTSELYAPSQIQALGDFTSAATSASTETTFDPAGYENVDWGRLLDYQVPTGIAGRGFSSWIYQWGWRVIKRSNNEAYWLCRLCHNTTNARRPTGHIHKATATNSASHHLRTVNRLAEEGPFNVEQPSQTTLDAFANIDAMRSQFDFQTFKSLILRLFATIQAPMTLIEDDAFRAY